jgi:7-cyano-7-deazaguanine reductase
MTKSIPLGQSTAYSSQYDASLLYPIPRKEARQQLGLSSELPFKGEDCWTGYELSWLDNQGKPQAYLAEFRFDFDSPNIIESKSFKLYLNSFNQTTFASAKEVETTMRRDLSAQAGTEVKVNLYPLSDLESLSIASFPGRCIDSLSVEINDYHPKPDLLKVSSEFVANDIFYSQLLKTNCPVTGQPDWATVFVEYSGDKIVPESLLAYIVSFREHQDFHENCVERMFCDIKNYCKPDSLCVYARYTRRGGLDINPLRSDYKKGESQLEGTTLRTIRQ